MAENQVINLYTESNPNPNSLKFVANFMLVSEGENHDFRTVESASDSPLAQKLFELPYVEGVFFMSNFVTVTKTAETDWYEVKGEVQELIKSYLETGAPLLTEPTAKAPEMPAIGKAESATSTADLEQKIVGILDEYIKPAVEMDGGAIAFHSFNEGTVKVTLQGSCSGCPSSTVTLKAGIENLLKRMVPEVETVEAEGI